MTKEIERKFIITELPDVQPMKEIQISQSYLAMNGKEELRVRRVEENNETINYVTYKVGEGLVREEIEFEISSAMYFALTDRTIESSLNKTRRFFLEKGYEVAVDIYNKEFGHLMIAEVEFPSTEAAHQFDIPEWFGKEVTGEKTYKNAVLWKKLQNR